MKKKKRWKRAALSGAFAVLAGGWMGGGGMGNNSWTDGRILCGGSGHCGMVLAAARQAREETGRNAAALSGGVFQNTLLLRLCCRALERDGFTVLRHRLVPPNDGGLALGQALYGMYHLQ